MIVHFLDCVGAALLHVETGELLGLIKDIIIRPENGKIEAFWVKSVDHPFRHSVVQTQDIVEWKKNVYLKSSESIAPPEEILRIAEILDRETMVVGNSVVTQDGKKLGTVFDLDFNPEEFVLRNIYTEKRFLWASYQRRIISSANIMEIQPDKIIVREYEIKKARVILKETVLEN